MTRPLSPGSASGRSRHHAQPDTTHLRCSRAQRLFGYLHRNRIYQELVRSRRLCLECCQRVSQASVTTISSLD